jgi:hypothetical protein
MGQSVGYVAQRVKSAAGRLLTLQVVVFAGGQQWRKGRLIVEVLRVHAMRPRLASTGRLEL